ncbi:MAG: hypothetical protein OXF67_05280 [Cyanobacteria bacterium MAG CAR4_bin_6]|nr:hypothetical protein [Cyanobacteria bacterium MAG CAR4_bin_6]
MEGGQFKAEVAYGFPAANDHLTLTPGVAVALSPTSSTYGILWSLAPYSEQGQTEPWEIALEGSGKKATPQHPLWIIPSRSPSPSPSEQPLTPGSC